LTPSWEVPRNTHLDLRILDLYDEEEAFFKEQDTIPGIGPSFVSDDVMTKVAERLHG